MAVAYIPCFAEWVGLELKSVLGEFGQCCHHCRIFGCCFVHKNSTAECGAKIRIEHWLFVWHVLIIADGHEGETGRGETLTVCCKNSSRPTSTYVLCLYSAYNENENSPNELSEESGLGFFGFGFGHVKTRSASDVVEYRTQSWRNWVL